MLPHSSNKRNFDKTPHSPQVSCDFINIYDDDLGDRKTKYHTIGVTQRKFPHTKCCDEYLLNVSCGLCDINTNFITPHIHRGMTDDIVQALNKLHKHSNPIILSTGIDINELLLAAPNKKQLDPFENAIVMCSLCNTVVCSVKYLIAETCDLRYERGYRMMNLIKNKFNDHVAESECCRDNEALKGNVEEFIDCVNNILSRSDDKPIRNANIYPEGNFTELMNLIVSTKQCECGKSQVHTCNICGTEQKNINSHERQYERIITSHFTKNVKYNINDVITQINPKPVGFCNCKDDDEKAEDYYHRFSDNCIYYTTCDGYKCAICGLEYGEMPSNELVICHLKKCINEMRPTIRRYGHFCCTH